MSVINKSLLPPKYIENVQTVQYEALNGRAIIDKMTVTNSGAVNASFSVWIVYGAPDGSNLIIDDKTIAPNDTYKCPEMIGHIIENGGELYGISSDSNTLVLTISGREVT